MENNNTESKKQIVPSASAILDDGSIVEMVSRSDQHRTCFAIYNAGRYASVAGKNLAKHDV